MSILSSKLVELGLNKDKIHQFFIENSLTLSLAESCTGGGISASLVQIPNSSLYFLGSVVSYSRNSKEKILGVSQNTLDAFGEVSAQTAMEMALGALKQFESDIALSVTGIAGPLGGSSSKPVGTVFFGLASKGEKALSVKHFFEGDRQGIIALSVETAFAHLWKYSRFKFK